MEYVWQVGYKHSQLGGETHGFLTRFLEENALYASVWVRTILRKINSLHFFSKYISLLQRCEYSCLWNYVLISFLLLNFFILFSPLFLFLFIFVSSSSFRIIFRPWTVECLQIRSIWYDNTVYRLLKTNNRIWLSYNQKFEFYFNSRYTIKR